ncbi:MAG: hypothetical protein ABWY55_00945 [Microbacterium sp.]
MRELTMRDAIEELIRGFSATWSRERGHLSRAERAARPWRPHRARSTFTPVSDGRVARNFAI